MPKSRRSVARSGKFAGQIGLFLVNPKVNGTLLVTVSALTLLSLLSFSRGQLTDIWIDLLQRGFGAGAWGVPIVTGFLGFWIILRSLDHMPHLSWQRPAGLGLLFLCFVTALALAPGLVFFEAARVLSPAAASAGGWVGSQLGAWLRFQLGTSGAWLVILVTALTGFYMMQPELCLRAAASAQWALARLWARMGEVPSRHRKPKPWRQTRGYRALQWLRALRIDTEPWQRRYAEWERRYFDRVERLRQRRVETSDVQPEPAPTAAAARPPASVAVKADAPEEPRPAAEETAPVVPPQPYAGDIERAEYWPLPDLNLILETRRRVAESDERIRRCGVLLQETLALFGVPASFEGAYKGPAVTQYLIKPGFIERLDSRGRPHRTKVKVSKITSLQNDLALAVAAQSVRIEAPIPGTSYVGIEISNANINSVSLKELFESEQFQSMDAALPLALGEDVKGKPIVADLARMPHLLIAGATGTGKSVCINAIITTLLLSHTPDTLRFLLIDPKMVELNDYNEIPHLIESVVTDVEEAERVLEWCVQEMDRRYRQLNQEKARDIRRFNAKRQSQGERPLPYIVAVIDEMADLMMSAPQEVERSVCRLAQMARAVGIHLIIATQRPSVDVITGLIKANFPARVAFAVSSQTDSRVIIDAPGAERLLGKGDMLFVAPDATRSGRVQGTWVSDAEIHKMVAFWKAAKQSRERAQSSADAEEQGPTPTPAAPLPAPAERSAAEDDAPPFPMDDVLPVPPARVPSGEAGAQEFLPVTPQPEPAPAAASARVDWVTEAAEEDDGVLTDENVTRSQEDARAPVPTAAEALPVDSDPARAEPSSAAADPESEASVYARSVQLAQGGAVCSASLLQRRLKVGKTKALALLDQMMADGHVDEERLDSRTFMDLIRYRERRPRP